MDTIKINRKNVKMVAHRGLSGLERENTNPAFVAAGNRSYFGIETDIHVTADGKYVVIHDETTKRVSDEAIDLNVEECTYDEIKNIVLPDKDGSTDRGDIRIPLLQEYVQICKKYDKVGVLELKNRFTKEQIAEVIEIIKGYDYLDQIIFISFSLENCIDVRELLPNQKVQWLIWPEVTEEMKNTLYQYKLDLDVYYGRMSKELAEELHSHGVEINCWTCDNKEAAEELVEMGVDYITSNILE